MTTAARRWIVLPALVVLLVPVLWSWAGTVRHEGVDLRANLTRDRAQGDFLAPFVRYSGGWPQGSDLARFARLVERRVPPSGLIVAEGAENTTWLRALAYAVAPRLVVSAGNGEWTISRSVSGQPAERGERSWNVGDYWLVRR